MLIITNQPRIACPITPSRPIRWRIATDAHVANPGLRAILVFRFNGGGGFSNGDTLVVRGVTFTVDDSTPYTYNTWDGTGTAEEAAKNLADALRSNYAFRDFSISVTNPSVWLVTLAAYEIGNQAPLDTNTTGLSVLLSVDRPNGEGEDIELNNFRIWYRLYSQDQPLTSERFANVPFDPSFNFYGVTTIDATEQLRGLVRTEPPHLLLTGPIQDPSYSLRVHLRFGAVEGQDNCEPAIQGQVYQSSEVTVTNSVFQLHDLDEFKNHCPNASNPVRFLTDRPTSRSLCWSVHEWAHIWIEQNANFIGNYRVRYSFFSGPDDVADFLGTFEYNIFGKNTGAAYRIELGPNNPGVTALMPNGTTRYTIRIMGQVVDEFDELDLIQYGEQLERHITNCNCKAAEVYFLEDRGSWNTVVFEKVDERAIEQEELSYSRPLEFPERFGNVLFSEGERYSHAQMADQVFVLVSERLNETNRPIYEQLLRAPEAYIKTLTTEGNQVIRRVIFDRQRRTTFRQGEATRLVLPFRFNTKLRIHDGGN